MCADRGIKIVVNAGGLNPAGARKPRVPFTSGSDYARTSRTSRATICSRGLGELTASGEPFTAPRQGNAALGR